MRYRMFRKVTGRWFKSNGVVSPFGIFLFFFMMPCASAGRIEVPGNYPSPYSEYTNIKSTSDAYFATSSGYVGIGTASPTVKLDVAQNNAIKVGQAYLSSGGNYAELTTNEWYTGSGWTVYAAGVLVELSGTYARVHYHDASGNHTRWAEVNSTSGWAASCSQTLKQNIHPLTFADYALLREQFRKTDLFSYNRKDTPAEPEVGFISEHAPELILSGQNKTQVTILKAIGYLATIAKAHEIILRSMQKEAQDLLRENKQLKEQTRQTEELLSEIQGLKKEAQSLMGQAS